MNYVGVYVPPMTNGWRKEEHKEMLVDVLKGLEKIVMENSDIVIVGDFNCKEINWETLTTTGSKNSWSNRQLNWVVENLMTQWVDCDTRFSGRDKPSRLGLVLTKDMEIIETIHYDSPLGE